MVKPKINYWIDVVMLIAFLITAITGIILFFMPSGPKSSLSSFLGVIKHTWSSWHQWLGIAMIILAIVHFLLHWKWFIVMTKNLFKRQI